MKVRPGQEETQAAAGKRIKPQASDHALAAQLHSTCRLPPASCLPQPRPTPAHMERRPASSVCTESMTSV